MLLDFFSKRKMTFNMFILEVHVHGGAACRTVNEIFTLTTIFSLAISF